MIKIRIETEDYQSAEKIDHPDDLKEWIEWAFLFGANVGQNMDNEKPEISMENFEVSFPQ